MLLLQALTLMSNLASGDEVHVQLLLEWGGSELLHLVSLLLQHADPKVVKQASDVCMPAACLLSGAARFSTLFATLLQAANCTN